MKFDNKCDILLLILFLLSVSSLVLPFLFVAEPPLLDYPNHLARTFILAHLHDPAFRFSEYYRADWKPYPFILWDVLMVALQRILPVEAAGKLLVMLITVLLPVSVAWFIWQANRTDIILSFLACPLSYCAMFLWGFTAFQLSVGLSFLMIGTWLWYRRKPSTSRAALFLTITYLTYLAHLLGFASAAFVLVLYELTAFSRREMVRLVIFLAPPSLLALWARPGLWGPDSLEWTSFTQKLRLFRGLLIHGYNKELDLLFAVGLVLCFLAAVLGNRELRINWRWLVVTIGLFGTFLLLPHSWGTSVDVDSRLVPFIYLVALAVFRIGSRANWIIALAVALTALRVVNIATGFQRETQKSAAMNDGIRQIPRDAKVFVLVSESAETDYLDDENWHYWAYAVIRRGATTGSLFDIRGQTPMRITYEPYTHSFEGRQIDWKFVSTYYDYIWSYGDDQSQPSIRIVADEVFEDGPLILYRVRPH
jgi:hypothetical protein